MKKLLTHYIPGIVKEPLLLVLAGFMFHTGTSARNGASERSATPAGFEENKGQVRTTSGGPAPFVRYRLSQGNTHIFLLENGIAYQFNRMHYPEGYREAMTSPRHGPEMQPESNVLYNEEVRLETYRMNMLLEGADPNPRITTGGRSSDYTHYYNHDVPDVYTYTKVIYHNVYPGIDWVVYLPAGQSGYMGKGMKYDFVVHPGADPAQIRLRFEHHEELYVDDKGGLVHGNRLGQFREERPVSFQGGKEVSTHFVLKNNVLRFSVEEYDRSRALTIDPARIWGTYYGGDNQDRGWACAVDAAGNVFLAGDTRSTAAIAANGHQNTWSGGDYDAFLVKFAANGARLWGTYYGGSNSDLGFGCAVDASGNVFLSGRTHSGTGIASGGHQNTFGGDRDAFLVKFSADGTRLWGTYYGESRQDGGIGCAVDAAGNVFLAGWTDSPTSIATTGHQVSYGEGTDAFLVKFAADGTRLWGTYYGGSGWENGLSCATDAGGNVFLTGFTHSTTAIASGGHQNTYGGGDSNGGDAFLVKFAADGTRLWGTYYGGSDADGGEGCVVDANGNVFLAGWTFSSTSIAAGGHQNMHGGEYDAFLVKFNAGGNRLWGTYYGGASDDASYSCTVGANGNVFLAGATRSTTAIASDGHQDMYGGGADDAFLAGFDAGGTRLWSTYYGGANGETSRSCAVDAAGNVFLAGWTGSGTAIAAGGHQNNNEGIFDAFLVKFGETVGIAEQARDAAPWYPNPTGGIVALDISGAMPCRRLSLFDATGRLLLEQSVTNVGGPIHLDLSSYEKGLYIIQARFADSSIAVQRVVKQ